MFGKYQNGLVLFFVVMAVCAIMLLLSGIKLFINVLGFISLMSLVFGTGLFIAYKILRTCIHNRGMPDGRGFFSSDKEIFRGNPDGLQGKSTQCGGKRAGQTAFHGCEYRF